MEFATPKEREIIALKLLGRNGKHEAYFTLYNELARRGTNFLVSMQPQAANMVPTHSELLIVVDQLKGNTRATRDELTKALQGRLGNKHSDAKIESLIHLAVQAMVMVDSEWHSPDFTLGGFRPQSWRRDETIVSFCTRALPTRLLPSAEAKLAFDQKSALKARKLRKRLGITFRSTDNLAEHMLFDQRGGHNFLYLFHQAGFLKSHLQRAHKSKTSIHRELDESLTEGTLPPQLLVETLHSLQAIIFPSTEPEEAVILNKLIRKQGFDPECAEYEGYMMFQDTPDDFKYVYWGERMASLHGLLKKRPPRNRVEKWFDWQSSEGNAVFIALSALFITIFVGIVSIVLQCLQVWIAWMALKHPASGVSQE